MCPKSFGGVRVDIKLCMSCFNHVLFGDTLRRDTISSLYWQSEHVLWNEAQHSLTLASNNCYLVAEILPGHCFHVSLLPVCVV